MKKAFKYPISMVLVWLFLGSCEEVIDWNLPIHQNGKLVVEAIITNELKRHTIQLTESKSLVEDETKKINDAAVYLEANGNMVEFVQEPANPGSYISVQSFSAQKDVTYKLKIFWHGEWYEASEQMSIVQESGSLNYAQIGDTPLYRLNDVAPLYHPIEQAMYEVTIDWSHLRPNEVSKIRTYFFTFNTVDGSELFRPEKEAIIFPKTSIATITKFGLSDDYASYLRALMLETQWQGGIFDENSSSLPTNISNGGLGYFAVCSVLKKQEQIF